MRFSRILYSVSILCLTTMLCAQMMPEAPVKNFRFPRFGDSGYTEWVLEGAKGIYDGPEQIRIEGMALRVYSGDERMALELSMDSPEATLRLKENRGFSEGYIEVEGANFKISGIGWSWSGETKEIVVKEKSVVRFTQGISAALGGQVDSGETLSGSTVIRSERLVLRTSVDEYYFEFTGGVEVESDEMSLNCEQLIAFADVPEGRVTQAAKDPDKKLDSIRKIIAREDVVITQDDRQVAADEAQFIPADKKVTLTGNASVSTKGAYLSGTTIESNQGKIVIAGTAETGRAQMILTETGGLGIDGASALSDETIVLADTISMEELNEVNLFTFDQRVEVISGALLLNSESMRISANKKKSVKSAAEEDSVVKVGEVMSIVADGGIRIEQGKQVVTAESVTFYPAEERALLVGNPKVTNGEAVVTGIAMELKPKLVIITGSAKQAVIVRLPKIADLGYEAFGTDLVIGTDSNAVDRKAEAKELRETVISSRMLHMVEDVDQTIFRFIDEVDIVATNLAVTCQRLDVFAQELKETSDGGTPELELERVEAQGEVVISQAERTATSGRAFIFPKEGELILEEDVVVEDKKTGGKVMGSRAVLKQGVSGANVSVEGGGTEDERVRITLPEMPSRK